MGKIDREFLDYIFDIYPELKSISLEFEDREITFSDVNYLLPYLAFTNSLDEENRLINVFHPPFSEHHKIIPFYITLAVFKKEIEKIRGTLHPIENEVVVSNNGSKCRLSTIDLKNEKIHSKSGSSAGYMSFDEFLSPFITPYSPKHKENFNKLKALINKHRLINSESIKTLLKTPDYLTTDYGSGVIIFTQKGKFETLFKNLKVSGLSIDNRIPAVAAIYEKRKHCYRYDFINDSDYTKILAAQDANPFILIASYLDIEFIDEFREKYPHLDTVIFDEAENKLDYIEKVIRGLKKDLNVKTEGSLKDVYLLTSDSSLNVYYKFKWDGDLPFHWITTPKDIVEEGNSKHQIHIIDEGIESTYLNELENLEREIRSLFRLINYEEISSIYESLNKIVIRYYSIFDLKNFQSSLKDLEKEFETFSKTNLDKTFDKKLIDDFGDTVDKLSEIKSSLKFKYLNLKKNEFKFHEAESIGIVTRNKNPNDQRKLLEWFSQFDAKIEFIDFNRSLKSVKEQAFDILLFLEIRKPYINSLFIHEFSGRIYLLLTEYEYNFYKRNFYRITKILNRITSRAKREELLNIKQQFSENFIQTGNLYKASLKDYVVNKKFLNLDQELKNFDEESFTDKEKDLLYEKSEKDIRSLIIESIEREKNVAQNTSSGKSKRIHEEENVLLIFDDNSIQKVSPNKKFYRILEEDVSNINDLVIQADQIEKGDDLLLFQIDHNDIVDLLMEKIRLSEKFSSTYELSEKWRNNVKALCNQVGYKRASELLSEYIERKPVTLENWCNGTTLAPHQHKKVIEGLNKIAYKYGFKNMEYLPEVDAIKSASSNIKGLLFSLPRKLKERSIRKLYDLNLEVDNRDKDETRLLDEILNDVDIKTVSYALKNY